jgi:pimeloyl-ACP methyl ester carboxylesterase
VSVVGRRFHCNECARPRNDGDCTELRSADIYSKQRAWTTFRFGPGYPVIYDNSRFPFDAIDQYAAQWVLTYRDAAELNKIADGITAVIDRVCPCILMTHSQSGPQGLRAALRRPNLVKAYISVEPAGFAIPAGESAATLANVPILTVFGDYVGQNPGDPAVGWLNSAQNTTTLVNAAGGNASVLVLPDQGIIGNTHMMMMDNNNEQIAGLIETWIQNNVPGVKGKYKP